MTAPRWPTAVLLALAAAPAAAQDAARADHVVLVTIDGLRWQEVFGGADEQLVSKEVGGVRDLLAFRRRWWRGTPEQRRRVLLPFLWQVVAERGQLIGDPAHGSRARVRNPHHFSYPGYHELLVGFVDERIDSNAKRPNPNATVLEWLGGHEPFAGRVAAFCTWDVFPFILNVQRSGMYVHSCWEPLAHGPDRARTATLNGALLQMPRYWADNSFDVLQCEACIEYVRARKPRVVYVALGETDAWAHERRYDLYLEAAWRSDRFLARLWQTMQGMDEYRDRTALVVTTDHGRGAGNDWTSHGKDIGGCDAIWFALLGAGVAPGGVRRDVQATQGQTAATVADLLGLDWRAAEPRAASPLPR